MGILDRVIGEISPGWALRRARARAGLDVLNTGYSHHGASHLKKSFHGWVSSIGGPDSDITLNLRTLRERSRDLCMGGGLAIGGLKGIRVNEVGAGLQLNAAINSNYLGLTDEQARQWEDNVEREFGVWAGTKMCDAARRNNFGELQALARLSQLMSGDSFALLPIIPRDGERYDLRVHLIEADRVCNPLNKVPPIGADILEGVEVGDYGEPLAFWIADRHPFDFPVGTLRLLKPPTWTRVPAFGSETGRPIVLHLMESERPGQRRGVPLLAPVIEELKQLSRYTQAELMAAVVSGMFTAAITSERPNPMPGPVIPPSQQVKTREPDPEPFYQLGNGAVLGLLPGEKMEAIDPGRPNSGFEPFVVALCRQIGAGIGVPYEVLVMNFTSSYSASRGALLEAWKRFKVGRTWLTNGFCQPVYEQWLEEAVARGYVQAPGFFADPMTRAAWCGAEWHGPTQGQLDPVKEVQAAEMRVASGFSTRARETAELTGGNFERFNQIRGREEQLRRDANVIMAPTPISPDEPEQAQEAVA